MLVLALVLALVSQAVLVSSNRSRSRSRGRDGRDGRTERRRGIAGGRSSRPPDPLDPVYQRRRPIPDLIFARHTGDKVILRLEELQGGRVRVFGDLFIRVLGSTSRLAEGVNRRGVLRDYGSKARK